MAQGPSDLPDMSDTKGGVRRVDLRAALLAVFVAERPPFDPAAECERWRYLFEERAGIRQHDGGLPRADAEAGALADCVARWRLDNPLPASSDAACVHCGKTQPDTPVLARGGHVWLHRECWVPMNALRNERAFAAVRALLGYAP